MAEGTSGALPGLLFRDGARRAALGDRHERAERLVGGFSRGGFRTAAGLALFQRGPAFADDRGCPNQPLRG
jgi:hypothetical protein